jgi:hypothetical protein
VLVLVKLSREVLNDTPCSNIKLSRQMNTINIVADTTILYVKAKGDFTSPNNKHSIFVIFCLLFYLRGETASIKKAMTSDCCVST